MPSLGDGPYQPGRPSCLACFSTSWSYCFAASSAFVWPEPTAVVMFSSDGPLIGDRNSSAGELLPPSMYGWMSLIACGTSSGSVQPLTTYGPDGATPAVIALQPSTVPMKLTNALAASSCAPVVVFGMYVAAGIQIVAPFVAASVPGCPKKPILSFA